MSRLAQLDAALARLERLGEWPWLLASLVPLLRFGRPPDGIPSGPDWHQYLASALYFSDPAHFSYADWRAPLYPWLLSLGGGLGSHTLAAQGLSRVAVWLAVLGAALVARGLGGRAAALVAALLAAQAPALVSLVDQVGPYPLLAGVAAVALGAGACCARSGAPWAALLAGLFGGLAAVTDVKGLGAAAGAGALVLLGALRGPAWRPPLLLLAAGLGAAAPLRLDRALREAHAVEVLPSATQVANQRGYLLDQIRGGILRDPALVRDCDPLPTDLDLAALRHPCAAALFRHNARSMAVFPDRDSQALGALALLPALAGFGRSRRASALRSVAASLLVAGAVAGPVLLGMAWVSYWDRYAAASFGAALALLPVAAARVAGLGPWPRLLALLLMSGLILRGFAPSLGGPAHPSHSPPVAAEATIPWLAARLADGDLVFDCAKLHPELALAPRKVDRVALLPERGECARATPSPGRRSWLIQVGMSLGQGPGGPAPAAQLEARGWRRVEGPSPAIEVWVAPG